jgi:hypothetical protein
MNTPQDRARSKLEEIESQLKKTNATGPAKSPEKRRKRYRRSCAEQAREAFRAQGVAKRRERRDCDPAGEEP